MAYSSSIKRAQDIKLCDLCGEENIKWRCIDCDKCLCQKCQTIHLKITEKHQIVSIATPIKEIQRKVITDNIPCRDHVTMMHCMFCESCNCLVCPKCVSSAHANHRFIPIEDALDTRLEQIKVFKAKVGDNLKSCDSKSKEIQNLKLKYHSICVESVVKIKQKEQDLKDAISKCSQFLQEKVKVQRSKFDSNIMKVEQEVTRAIKNLEDMNTEMEETLSSNQGQIIFENSLTDPILKFDPLSYKAEAFIPEGKPERPVEELFGSFKAVVIPTEKDKLEFNFNVLRTFTTDLSKIFQVIPLDANSAWIICKTSITKLVRKITIQETNIETSTEISMIKNPYDMALTSSNDLFLTFPEQKKVKQVTKSGEIKSFITIKSLKPLGIHMTSNNKIIVGVKEPGNIYSPNDQSQRAVMVYDQSGNRTQTYHNDRHGSKLFTFPYRITTNNNQDISVIDLTSDKTGRLVTLDREGELRWVYEGHPKINEIQSFYPAGITTTSSGYIIISDHSTHALHVLSENGDVLTCKVMSDMGIIYPRGLNMDKNGYMWVGCSTGGKVTGAKLHIVKMLY